ncbi:MAG: DUF2256 domain-containing protein [Pseudomonadota bacterium]
MKRRGKSVAKGNLPQKDCKTCGRPFTWRKKWERVWDEVQYCSDRCRRERPKGGSAQ